MYLLNMSWVHPLLSTPLWPPRSGHCQQLPVWPQHRPISSHCLHSCSLKYISYTVGRVAYFKYKSPDDTFLHRTLNGSPLSLGWSPNLREQCDLSPASGHSPSTDLLFPNWLHDQALSHPPDVNYAAPSAWNGIFPSFIGQIDCYSSVLTGMRCAQVWAWWDPLLFLSTHHIVS